jgi:hypothetical protein
VIDEQLSAALRTRVHAGWDECYDNALRAFPLAPPGTRYVLGTYGDADEPHAWLETPDGKIVEVTPHPRPPRAETYRAHRRYAAADLAAARVESAGLWPPLAWLAPLCPHVPRDLLRRFYR